MNIINKLKFLSAGSVPFLVPVLAFAQDGGNLNFVNSIALWVAVAVGLVATAIVLRNAMRIGGSALQRVYYFFGFGMLLTVLGFFAVVVPPWADPFVIMRTHDVLFIIGFGLMAYGASKMLSDAGM